jgi:IS6 family transposase
MLQRRRFQVEISLLCVRWYCKYGINYGISPRKYRSVAWKSPSTDFRSVQRYALDTNKYAQRIDFMLLDWRNTGAA